MINLDLINNIKVKSIDNVKTLQDNNTNSKSEIKNDFKNLLNKEAKKDIESNSNNISKKVDTNKDIKEVSSNEDVDSKDIKENLEKVLEKIEEIKGKNFQGNNDDKLIEINDIIDVISLLSNLIINVEVKNNTNLELKNENISLEDALDSIKNLISKINFNNEKNISGSVNNSGNSKNIDNINIDNINIDNKALDNKNIKDVLSSLESLISNILFENSETNNINLDKEAINNKILEILNSISEDDLERLNLPENDNRTKNIMTTLINIKNYNEDFKDSNLSKDEKEFNLKNIINTKILANNTENFRNDNKLDNNSLNGEINKEDKILSKLLGEDNKGAFGNILNSYSKLNNNSVQTLQKPEFINQSTFNGDIIKSVKYMMKNNIEELTVKVYPKELGELTIKILSEEGIMKAEIKATSKEAYSILNANIGDIKNSLSEQNLKIQDVQVAIYNEDTTFFSNRENSKDGQKNNDTSDNKIKISDSVENEDLSSEDSIENNVNLLA